MIKCVPSRQQAHGVQSFRRHVVTAILITRLSDIMCPLVTILHIYVLSFHDYDGERRSHLSARMYLPESEYERTNPRSLYHKSRSFDDLSEHERRP